MNSILSLVTIAESSGATSISDVMATGLTSVASDMTGMIQTMLPIALGVVGVGLAVMFGIKYFKKLTNRA